jgi:hypothetical protein
MAASGQSNSLWSLAGFGRKLPAGIAAFELISTLAI